MEAKTLTEEFIDNADKLLATIGVHLVASNVDTYKVVPTKKFSETLKSTCTFKHDAGIAILEKLNDLLTTDQALSLLYGFAYAVRDSKSDDIRDATVKVVTSIITSSAYTKRTRV